MRIVSDSQKMFTTHPHIVGTGFAGVMEMTDGAGSKFTEIPPDHGRCDHCDNAHGDEGSAEEKLHG